MNDGIQHNVLVISNASLYDVKQHGAYEPLTSQPENQPGSRVLAASSSEFPDNHATVQHALLARGRKRNSQLVQRAKGTDQHDLQININNNDIK